MKILILGHNGMLGNINHKYFKEKYDVEVLNGLIWDTEEFKNKVMESDADFVINCIGAIPQKKGLHNKEIKEYYKSLNFDLPIFLESTNKKIIHPSTDCIFSGSLEYPKMYGKNDIIDAYDDYGISKGLIDNKINSEFHNTKIIRTSIIGHEINSKASLLDWFLSNDDDIELNGHYNYWWNGVTTLQWCKIAENIILNWDTTPTLTQVGSNPINKYELLKLFKKIYGKPNKVVKFNMDTPLNKMLVSDFELPTIETQIIELKKIYNK